MRPSIVIAVLVVLGLAVGGGYYEFDQYAQKQFRIGLDHALGSLPPGTTASYKTARYSFLSHQAVVTGLTVHGEIPGSPPQPFEISAVTFEVEKPNPELAASWAGAVSAPATFGQDTSVPVADTATLTDLMVQIGGISLTEGSFHVTNLRVYPWALLHDGMPSWSELMVALAPRRGPPDPVDLQKILRAEAAAVMGVGYDRYEAGPMKLTETLSGTDAEYEIRTVTGDGFDRGTIKGGAGEGITFRGKEIGMVSVDRVAIGPIDLRQPMTRIVNGEVLSTRLLDGIKLGRIDYNGISAQLPGQSAIHMGGLSVGPVTFTGGLPVSGKLGWTDISIARTQVSDPRAQMAFDRLGLQTMTMSFTIAYDWDIGQQHISLHDTMLKVNELGTMNIAADLTNATPNTAGFSRVSLAHAGLRFDDASLVNRALRAGAAQAGTDPVTFRQRFIEMVRQQANTQGAASPVMTAACNAAGDFIASPHSLTVELAPPQPIPLMMLKSMNAAPAAMATTLGLVVSTSQ